MASTTPEPEVSASREESPNSNKCVCCSCIPRSCDRYKDRLVFQGWKKWSLFGLVCLLILIVVVNIGLTLWMMTIMRFSASGMGALRVLSNGILVDGDAMVMDRLVASSVSSGEGRDLELRSYGTKGVNITTCDKKGNTANRIHLDPEHVEYFAEEMSVRNIDGDLLFHINEEEVAVGAKAFTVLSEAGVVFEKSIQTPQISSIGKDLKIESLTRTIAMEAPQDINVESSAGNINIKAQEELDISSIRGKVRLRGKTIVLEQLDKAFPLDGNTKGRNSKIYQLCACENGRLFLARAATPCETTDTDYICR